MVQSNSHLKCSTGRNGLPTLRDDLTRCEVQSLAFHLFNGRAVSRRPVVSAVRTTFSATLPAGTRSGVLGRGVLKALTSTNARLTYDNFRFLRSPAHDPNVTQKRRNDSVFRISEASSGSDGSAKILL